MKHLFIFTTLLFFVSSCGKDDPIGLEEVLPEVCENGTCDFTFKENPQIQDITGIDLGEQSSQIIAQVVEGENLVFKYLYQKDDSPQIADDELTTELIFAKQFLNKR